MPCQACLSNIHVPPGSRSTGSNCSAGGPLHASESLSCALCEVQVSTMFVPLAREGWLQKLVATKLHPFGVWKVCILHFQERWLR